MNRQIIPYTTEADWLSQRVNDLTSTDVAALFGLSPYKTNFELWHEKKSGERVEFKENERVTWGKRLEPAVAQGIADDQGWCIRPMKEYVRLPELRIGSSFDFLICASDAIPSPDDAILEIKCVDWLMFRDGWTIDEGFIEAPAHIEIQVQHQLLVAGLRKAYIGVMVGGNDIRVIEREADPDVHAGILAVCAAFWESIDANKAPDPVMPDDADAVIRMNQFAQPGKFLDARDDAELATMLREYARLGMDEKLAAEQRKVVKADILRHIGDAEKVITSVGKISASITGPAEIKAFTRAPFRNLRVTMATKQALDAEAAE
jgi:putative phage-type endonuclease